MAPPGSRFRHRKHADQAEGTFDPEDTQNVRHTKLGVWDLYEQIEPKLKMVPWSVRSKLEAFHEMSGSFPYVVRMFKDIGSIGRTCYLLFAGYVLITVLLALIPAIELWYSGLLLKIVRAHVTFLANNWLNCSKVQNAVEQRSVDRRDLFKVALSRLVCAAISRLLTHAGLLLYRPLNDRIKQHYALQTFQARARLDVPTYADSAVQRQLDESTTSSRTSIAWNSVLSTLHLLSTAIELVTQFSVLFNMLRDQRDGPLLATLSFGHTLFRNKTRQRNWQPTGGNYWSS
jgi:hypothetical protein